MIRKGTEEDLPAMHAMALEFYSQSKFLIAFDLAKFTEIWKHFLKLGIGVIFVDDRGGKIRGTIGGIIHPDLYSSDIVVEELFWFVCKDSRTSGPKLYWRFEGWAKEHGAKRLQMVHLLDSMPEKVGRFYAREGFEPIETRYSKDL